VGGRQRRGEGWWGRVEAGKVRYSICRGPSLSLSLRTKKAKVCLRENKEERVREKREVQKKNVRDRKRGEQWKGGHLFSLFGDRLL